MGYIEHIECADNRNALPGLEDEMFDMLLTDPPYGLSEERNKVTKVGQSHVTFEQAWDMELPTAWIPQSVRVTKMGGWLVIFTDKREVRLVWDVLVASGAHPRNTFYWVKTNPPPTPRRNFSSGVEVAVCATRGKVGTWNGGGSYPNYALMPIVSANRIHPTQKPVELMEHLLLAMTNPGDVVFDPFFGSGSTIVACIRNKRGYFGFERDPIHFDAARRRIEKEHREQELLEAQLPLFKE